MTANPLIGSLNLKIRKRSHLDQYKWDALTACCYEGDVCLMGCNLLSELLCKFETFHFEIAQLDLAVCIYTSWKTQLEY